VNVGLAHLVDEGSAAHVQESRTFNTAKQAAGGQRAPASYEELQEARRLLLARPSEGRAVERIARAGHHRVPVRVTTPSAGESRAVYLDIHAGGFYMGSAVQNDAMRVWPTRSR
jgi:acetyl esterase